MSAFKATLEGLADADLLLHVVDAADENLDVKKKAVEKLFEELDIAHIPRLLVLNKADLLPSGVASSLARRYGGVPISAAKRQGLRELIHSAEEILKTDGPFLKGYSLPPENEVTPFANCEIAADEPEELIN